MAPAEHRVERIVSGGQTGVDRAALDVALDLGIPAGGWCPRGRRAEDGRIPERYPLAETASAAYPPRTEANVRDSDGTLVLHLGRKDRGTGLTARLASRHGRPCHEVDLRGEADVSSTLAWLAAHRISTLNVAGPRESSAPGAHAAARAFLLRLLAGDGPLLR